MFPRCGNVHTPNLMAPIFNYLPYFRRDLANMVLIESAVGDENVELIEIWFLAQELECVEIDVAVDYVFHSCLSLTNIMDPAADDELVFNSVTSFYGHLITNIEMGNLKGVAFNE